MKRRHSTEMEDFLADLKKLEAEAKQQRRKAKRLDSIKADVKTLEAETKQQHLEAKSWEYGADLKEVEADTKQQYRDAIGLQKSYTNTPSRKTGKPVATTTSLQDGTQIHNKQSSKHTPAHTNDYFKRSWGGEFEGSALFGDGEKTPAEDHPAKEHVSMSEGDAVYTGIFSAKPGMPATSAERNQTLLGSAGVIERLANALDPADGPPDAATEKDKGNVFFKKGKYLEALECYSRSIALQPTAIAFANRAMASLKLNRYKEAEADCTEALDLDDMNVKAFSRRGTARREMGKFEGAISDFEAALELEPDNKELLNSLSLALARQQKVQAGKQAGLAEQHLVPQVSRKVSASPPAVVTGSRTTALMQPPARPESLLVNTALAPQTTLLGQSPAPHLSGSSSSALQSASGAPSPGHPQTSSDRSAPHWQRELSRDVVPTVEGDQAWNPATSATLASPEPPTLGRNAPASQQPAPPATVVSSERASAPGFAEIRASRDAPSQTFGASPRKSQSVPAAIELGNVGLREGSGTSTAAQAVQRKAVSAARQALVRNMTPPRTAYDFEALWRSLAGDRTSQAKILQITDPAKLPSIFKEALTSSLLFEILVVLGNVMFLSAAGQAVDILENLPKIPRFSLTLMLMASEDKYVVRQLWDTAPELPPSLQMRMASIRPNYRL